MLLRRTLPAVIAAIGLAGCPSVDREASPDRIAVATFDAAAGVIPTPNDLALQRAPAQVGLQRSLLLGFVANGGWPNDQEVAVTIPVSVRALQADGSYGAATPAAGIDLATVNDESVAFLQTNTGTPERILRCPTSGAPTATCWEPVSAPGALTLRRNGPDGHRRWPAGGRFVVALRNTVRTSDGLPLAADQAIALIAPNQSLTAPENAPPGTTPAQLAPAEQLRGLYASGRFWTTVPDAATCAGAGVPVTPCWLPIPAGTAGTPAQPTAFESVATVFPTGEMVSIQTFAVSASTFVRPLTDSGSGQVPLPSDFLLDPATGRVRNVPAFGPAAAGLTTLDGFSTTAPLFMPLTAAVKASSINRNSVRIFKVGTFNANNELVPLNPPQQLTDLTNLPTPPQIVTQPPTSVANGLTSTLVLAPAVPVQLPPELGGSFVPVPPLDERSQYLVVVTNQVLDAQDRPLRRSTLMDIIFTFEQPIFSASPVATEACPAGQEATCSSRIAGVSSADAAGLQRLRNSVGPVLDAFSLRSCADNATCAVLAYTVRTQTVKEVTVNLAAVPYAIEAGASAAVFTPTGTADFDTATAGIPFSAATFPNVGRIVQTTVPTLNAIDPATGAFRQNLQAILADPTQVVANLRPLRILAAIPAATNAALNPLCPGSTTIRCAPLVVFQHGIGGAATQFLPVASRLADRGFVVASVDLPYHGERSFCSANDQCALPDGSNGTCTPDPAFAGQGDGVVPGTCTGGSALRFTAQNLAPAASGNYFVSANFFRTRDAIRQSAIDHSVVTLALARPPAGVPQVEQNDFRTALGQAGLAVDPTRVYFAGLSLGAETGTSIVATNPRYSRATFTANGAPLVDVFTQSPSIQPRLPPIFEPLGVDLTRVSPTLPDGSPNPNFDAAQAARYSQLLAIAKWIMDPAEPANYAANLQSKVFAPQLQPLVAGGAGSATTSVYGQMVVGDQTILNPFSRLVYGLSATPFTTYTPADTIPAAQRHSLLLVNFTNPATPAQEAGDRLRDDIASFLATGTLPSLTRTVP